MINAQTLRGNWNEAKGSIKHQWSALTNDDLRSFDGNVDRLVGKIQRKTGETRAAVESFLEDLTADGSSMIANGAEKARDFAHRVSGTLKETLQDSYEQVSDRIRDGYSDAGEIVRHRPAQAVAVAFGAGIIGGLILAMFARSR